MLRDIVVFERWSEEMDQAELDFRLVRGALPNGSCPLAIADRHDFYVAEGQWFSGEEIKEFAEIQSGFRAA